MKRVTPADWNTIIDQAILDAQNGDRWARKWLSDYLMPPPSQIYEYLSVQAADINIRVEHVDEAPRAQVIEGEVVDG
jgi:hypothetical protein